MMKDYPRFILRGAAAGAALEISVIVYFWGYFVVALFYTPVSLVYMILPGATVGLALCAVAGQTGNALTPAKRFSIGTAVVAVLAAAGTLYMWASEPVAREYGVELWMIVPRVLAFAAGVGGLAGLACPSTRQYVNRESELPYRERARQYEADEREAKRAREPLIKTNSEWEIRL